VSLPSDFDIDAAQHDESASFQGRIESGETLFSIETWVLEFQQRAEKWDGDSTEFLIKLGDFVVNSIPNYADLHEYITTQVCFTHRSRSLP
jgi:hypothetical protein